MRIKYVVRIRSRNSSLPCRWKGIQKFTHRTCQGKYVDKLWTCAQLSAIYPLNVLRAVETFQQLLSKIVRLCDSLIKYSMRNANSPTRLQLFVGRLWWLTQLVNAALFQIGNIVTCYVFISTDIITSVISPHESNNSCAERTINNDILFTTLFLHS